MNTSGCIQHIFEQVDKGAMTGADAMAAINPVSLAPFLRPAFVHTDIESTRFDCHGEGILEGDVSGVLVLSRAVAEAIIEYNLTASSPIRYIYCIDEGDVDDFLPIKHAVGFLTANKGKTTFSPVQAVQEGIPTVISTPFETHTLENPRTLHLESADGTELLIQTSTRYVVASNELGVTIRVDEGDTISFSGLSGNVFLGKCNTQIPKIPRLYSALIKCYFAARECFGAGQAWFKLADTDEYARQKDFIESVVNSSEFRGFQTVKKHAIDTANTDIFVNVHNDECVVFARLVASHICIENGTVRITTDESVVGVGLLRDERMWTSPEDIDLLRMLLLGRDALGESRFAQVRLDYIRVHSQALFNIMSVGTGRMCVARTLCMPFSKFLPDSFDIAKFCQKYDLDLERVQKSFRAISGERETYHGCRGIRLFCLREDIAEVWLTALLTAAKRTVEAEIPLKLRILLATLSFAEEVDMFLELFDRMAPQFLGDKVSEVVVGIASMLETSGAYIDFENIFSRSGRYAAMNGGLIGANDFTTACLNLNRGDAPRMIIPGYVKNRIFSASPFKHIHPTVGKAIITALHRSQALGAQLHREYLWGLAGELSYDWDSVQWLAVHAARAGLNYISTSPDTMIFALFAASTACSAKPAGNRSFAEKRAMEVVEVV